MEVFVNYEWHFNENVWTPNACLLQSGQEKIARVRLSPATLDACAAASQEMWIRFERKLQSHIIMCGDVACFF
jgi:hypothetical protein